MLGLQWGDIGSDYPWNKHYYRWELVKEEKANRKVSKGAKRFAKEPILTVLGSQISDLLSRFSVLDSGVIIAVSWLKTCQNKTYVL